MLLKNKIFKNIFVIFATTSFIVLSALAVFTLSKNYQTKKIAVPDLTNIMLDEAKATANNNQLQLSLISVSSTLEKNKVISQIPKTGKLIKRGDIVELIISSGPSKEKTKDDSVELMRKIVTKKQLELTESNESAENGSVEPAVNRNNKAKGKICIDPGHQLQADNSLEPIGPGSKTLKPRVTQGAIGVSTKKPEHELVLEISLKLKRYLEAKGFEVLLTREKADVNISNSQRAKIASDWSADLFIRIHADGSTNRSVNGILTLHPAKNKWTENFYQNSHEWAQIIHKALIGSTGRTDRGVSARSELSGFNWSKVPTILFEMGFLSNPEEDRLLNTDGEQQKIIKAVGDAIDANFSKDL